MQTFVWSSPYLMSDCRALIPLLLLAPGCLVLGNFPSTLCLFCHWIVPFPKPDETEPGNCQTPVRQSPSPWIFFQATKSDWSDSVVLTPVWVVSWVGPEPLGDVLLFQGEGNYFSSPSWGSQIFRQYLKAQECQYGISFSYVFWRSQ